MLRRRPLAIGDRDVAIAALASRPALQERCRRARSRPPFVKRSPTPRRSLHALAIAATLVLAHEAAAQGAQPRTPPTVAPARPVLRWGGDAEGGAPFVEADPADPSRLRGFDVEVAERLARGLGREPVFVQVAW